MTLRGAEPHNRNMSRMTKKTRKNAEAKRLRGPTATEALSDRLSDLERRLNGMQIRLEDRIDKLNQSHVGSHHIQYLDGRISEIQKTTAQIDEQGKTIKQLQIQLAGTRQDPDAEKTLRTAFWRIHDLVNDLKAWIGDDYKD